MSNTVTFKPSNTYMQVASGSQANKPELQKNSQDAAAGIAKYARELGVDTIDVNLLTKWATNADGKVPPDVQEKAQFFLANSAVLTKMESSDGTAPDGIFTLHNLDQAAQGRVDFKGLPETQKGELFTDHQEPAAIIAKYMSDKGIAVMDMNAIYSAVTKGDEMPSDVKKAFTYVLGNPIAYAEIESINGAAKDQLASAADFKQASVMKSGSKVINESLQKIKGGLEDYFKKPGNILFKQDGQDKPVLGQAGVKLAEQLEKLMTDNNIGLMSNEGLQKIINDSNASAGDKKLAQTLLDSPKLFEIFETQGGAAKDGLISIGDLKLAQGKPVDEPKTVDQPKPVDLANPTAAELKAAVDNVGQYLKGGKLAGSDQSLNETTLRQLKENMGGEVPQNIRDDAERMLNYPTLITSMDKNGDKKVSVAELENTNKKYIDKDGKDVTAETAKYAAIAAEYLARGDNQILNADGIFDISMGKRGVTGDVQAAFKFLNDNKKIRDELDIGKDGHWVAADFKQLANIDFDALVAEKAAKDAAAKDAAAKDAAANAAAANAAAAQTNNTNTPAMSPEKVAELKQDLADLEAYLRSDQVPEKEKYLDATKLEQYAGNSGGMVPDKIQKAAARLGLKENSEFFNKFDSSGDKRLGLEELAQANTKYLDKDGNDVTAKTAEYAKILKEYLGDNGQLDLQGIHELSTGDRKTDDKIKEAAKFFDDNKKIRDEIDGGDKGIWTIADFNKVKA
jgi:hypothetical protein